MTSVELPMAFWPSERGTLKGWRTGAHHQREHLWHDWQQLGRAALPLRENPPVIFGMTEGKHYRDNGNAPALTAAKVLSSVLGRCYDVRVGWHRSGDYGPVIFFDSRAVCLEFWGTPHRTVPTHWRNVADFTLRTTGGKPGAMFRVALGHWDFQDGDVRLQEATNMSHLADQHDEDGAPVRTLALVDCNETASGRHLPQRDWAAARRRTRRHKARKVNGVWVADTRAVDELVGEFDEEGQRRIDGAGFELLCETAFFDHGMPKERALAPTVYGVEGDAHANDFVFAANWPGGLVRESWTIHTQPENTPPDERPSDHFVQSWSMWM